jgi:hypothetical protein
MTVKSTDVYFKGIYVKEIKNKIKKINFEKVHETTITFATKLRLVYKNSSA